MAKVREVMTPGVVTVPAGASLVEAARLMRDEDVGVLPVTDNGNLVGIITDRDIVIRGLAEDRSDAPVGDLVTADVAWLTPDDDTRDAQNRMADHDVRRLPVVDNGQLVGIVSVGDLAVRGSSKLAGQVMEQTGPEE